MGSGNVRLWRQCIGQLRVWISPCLKCLLWSIHRFRKCSLQTYSNIPNLAHLFKMKTLTTIEVSSAFYRRNTDRPSYLMIGLRRQQEAETFASFPGPGLNTDTDLLIWTVGRSRAASNLGDPLEPMNLHMSCRQETSHTESLILSRLPASESLARQPLGWHLFVSFLWWVNPSSSSLSSWFLPLASWLYLPLHFCSLLYLTFSVAERGVH